MDDPNDVLDDETLQYLSALLPQGKPSHPFRFHRLTGPVDIPAFKLALSGIHGEEYAADKWKRYGRKFYEVSLQHQIGSTTLQ